MKPCIIFLTMCCVIITTVWAAQEITTIHFVSEEWEGFTNADGTGLYWDIFRRIYEPVGISVTFDIVPYIRATKMVQDQQTDAAAAVYADEFTPALFPKWHFDSEVVSALFKKGKVASWEGEASLSGRLGWIRGYEYDQYLSNTYEFVEVDSRKSAFKMLEFGHLDFFLDAATDLQTAMEKGEVDSEQFQMETVLQLNLYLAFAENDRGRQLMEIFDTRMTELIASGELKPLFAQWDSDYPFEE